MEAEAQIESKVVGDLTMTEVASFQILSHMVTDHLTEETVDEVEVDMTTTTEGQWTTVNQEADSREEVMADQTASSTAATVRESTTVTASTAIRKATSPSTAALLQDQEVNMADTVAVAAVEATITIEATHTETTDIMITEIRTSFEKKETKIDKTTSTVSESVGKPKHRY